MAGMGLRKTGVVLLTILKWILLLLPIFSDFRLLWLPVTELPDIMTLS